jgi:hypothetical protein
MGKTIEQQPTPYAVRHEVDLEDAQDPDRLLSIMMDTSLESIKYAVHHDGFDVSETSYVMGRNNQICIVSGANWTPYPKEYGADELDESTRNEKKILANQRTCALGSFFSRVVHPGDIFGGAVLIRSPVDMKSIVGCKDMKTLHSCGPCRPVVARLDPTTVYAGIRGNDREIQEALTIGQKIDYHENGGSYPKTPRQMTPKRFFLGALKHGLNSVVQVKHLELVRTTLDTSERT